MLIGIIGLGDMGKLYAKRFTKAGYQVCGSDIPANYEKLQEELLPLGIEVLEDGSAVSRKSDVIFYAVEAEKIGEVVQRYGPSTKQGAIVAGQTSVKHPEIEAFEKFLPSNVHIITCHSLHGPGFDSKGQTLIVIPHRCDAAAYQRMTDLLAVLESEIVELNYHEHDKITADTQAVTHMGFESMGTAWKEAGFFPWDNTAYIGGIDNVKILTMLRIFGYKAHIYAGLAILNPYARHQIKRYAQSESDLFKMMITENETDFRTRIRKVKDFLFPDDKQFLLLNNKVMKEFSLSGPGAPHTPNSHLSLLSMADAWYHLNINPYDNLICQTPPFRLRLGIVEYLFRDEELLEESVNAAIYNKQIRADDLEFHSAVREWSSIIGYGDMNGYKQHFNEAKVFFEDRLEHGRLQSAELISRLNKGH
ncbi:prephenate dehydrogenase [Pedobacter sp. L105]|uniref:prephenate dehydrogenase n=1 Tax=Pedobacter sp. L105 TaxID=1641871 RepID=UPI00131E6F27|nr:prephenate dehydrogenase [Pedobacter sp. L105]